MIKFNITRRKWLVFKERHAYTLPTSYGEMTLGQFIEYPQHTQTPSQLIAFLSKCPHRIDADQFAPLLAFLATPLVLDDFPADPNHFDIKRKNFGQKIEAHKLLKEDSSMRGVEAFLKIYYPEENIADTPLSVVLPRYFAIVEQLQHILKVEEANLTTPPTAEQMRAGIEEFSKLGYFNTIDDLAQGKPWRYDDILNTEYIVIYNRLLKMKISTKFGENYSAIMRETNKP